MKTDILRALLLSILCLGFAACATTSSTRTPGAPRVAAAGEPGVVVEEVGEGSALEVAGLRPGDLLFAWERPPDPPANPGAGQGAIRTVFDWSWVKTEQAPRGTVRLRGERDGVTTLFVVPKGVWEARVRPRMAADLLQAYAEGRRRIEAGDLEGGIALWHQLVQSGESQAVPGLRCWVLLRISEAWSQGRQGDKARAALQEALAAAGEATARVAVLEALGESYQYALKMADSEASLRAALEAAEAAWGESLQVASTITRLGNLQRLRQRWDEAARLHNRALEIRQRWAPDSLEVADSLNHLSLLAGERRDLEAMAESIRRALAILDRWPPDSLVRADTLKALGNLEQYRRRHAEATVAYQQAVAILTKRAPDSLLLATALSNLGSSAQMIGDPEAATALLQQALAIRERLAPGSLGTAAILANLAEIARSRGDLDAATALYQRILAMWTQTAPEGLGVAASQDALGVFARLRGDLDAAWDLLHRGLEIRERTAPGGFDVAESLGHLGMVAEARGDLGDLRLAQDLHQRALAIFERVAPGTVEEALTLHQLGRLHRRLRHPDQAAQLLARAVEALESQVELLGGTQNLQATFRARYGEIYRDAIAVELERGHAAAAFHLLERSRARSFLALLAERDLAFPGELPAELERARRDNAARYDQTLRELAHWTPAAGEEAREELHRQLGRLRWVRDEIAVEIRRASPRLAALRQPQALDLAAARKALDPGTLALSYSVGEDQTTLFAVTREGGLRMEILPFGEERLHQDVESFLEQVRQPTPAAAAAGAQPSAAELARSLYRALIGPVAGLVERSERVLILPDGPLHRLPFGALIRDPGGAAPGGRGLYLAEWKPLHTALSLTVYETLRTSGREPARAATAAAPARLVAFGDPRYPQGLAAAAEATRDPVRRSLGLGPRSFDWQALPYSRREIERIAEAYPGARLYLGEEATEERAKAAARDARILHFATHGYTDDRTPLDSALVLTIPEGLPADRDNGLLQVWEIFEEVRLDADLVVLSSCASALGRELSGEGLIGLTRAFQYAGARSVVATLWDVADQVTAELMVRFHRHLAAGLPKDEALRAAQIELIRQPVRITTPQGQALETDASAPFFWAAFQLFGDWR